MNQPVCTICNREGFGVLFPMTPQTEGFKFGTICDQCDEEGKCKHPSVAYIAWEQWDYPATLIDTEEGIAYYRLDYSNGEHCDTRENRFYCLDCGATIEGAIE